MPAIRILAALLVATAAAGCAQLGAPPDGTAYDILCPVTGTVSFSNDWGAPRSGGTVHEGNDIFAPMWTPSVAVVAGKITWAYGAKSGYAIWLDGKDGNKYFYAHFAGWVHGDATVGGKRDVAAGEIIAWVGGTGNANGVSHLHFEIHPNGGAPVNPYPTLYAECTNRTSPAAAHDHGAGDVSSSRNS
jgi:peptidoglycan LD-endopeptidase LytH